MYMGNIQNHISHKDVIQSGSFAKEIILVQLNRGRGMGRNHEVMVISHRSIAWDHLEMPYIQQVTDGAYNKMPYLMKFMPFYPFPYNSGVSCSIMGKV